MYDLSAPTNWNNNLISGIYQCFFVEYLSAILLWQFKEEPDTAINTGHHCIWQLQGIVRTIIHGTTMVFKYIHVVTKVIICCYTKLSSFREYFRWILSIPLVLKEKKSGKLDQYHSCGCRGNWVYQVIHSHDIDFVKWMMISLCSFRLNLYNFPC